MRGLEIVADLRVRDIMSSPVISVKESEVVKTIAKILEEHKIGSVVIIDEKGRPVGIITDRDLAVRVVGKGLLAKEAKAKEIMSAPLITISPNSTIQEAVEIMQKEGIKRLPVVDRGRLIGIISMKDVAIASQQLITIIGERKRLTETPVERSPSPLYGYCDRCRQWSDRLKGVEGQFLCEECRVELEISEE